MMWQAVTWTSERRESAGKREQDRARNKMRNNIGFSHMVRNSVLEMLESKG